ncbi:MAG: homoserine dehydrogenase [Phycisphaerales bacterium]
MAESAIGVGLIGCGTVGGGVAKLLREQAEVYTRRTGRPIVLRRLLDKAKDRVIESGLADAAVVTDDVESFFNTPDMSIVIELAGGTGAASTFVRRALESGRHVVTANKALLAEQGPELFALARKHNVSIAFEASCGGGIPCITALQFGLMANRIDALYGILNGTCNYILTEMTGKGKTYDAALADAQKLGYAEADPTLDVTGGDTAHKIAILASLGFGVKLTGDKVTARGIDQLDLNDLKFGAELGYDIKLLAIAEREPGQDAVSVGVEPCFIHESELLAQVGGAFNALSVYGHAVGHTLYYGQGAGRMPTASAVVADVMNIASGWYGKAFSGMKLTPDLHEPALLANADDLRSRYYLRINAEDKPGVIARITAELGDRGISLSAVLQHEPEPGSDYVPIVIVTHEARRGDLLEAVGLIASMDVIEGPPVMIRIVDMPD